MMKIYLIVLITAISQIGFSGSRVAVSLHALQLTSNQFAIGVVISVAIAVVVLRRCS